MGYVIQGVMAVAGFLAIAYLKNIASSNNDVKEEVKGVRNEVMQLKDHMAAEMRTVDRDINELRAKKAENFLEINRRMDTQDGDIKALAAKVDSALKTKTRRR